MSTTINISPINDPRDGDVIRVYKIPQVIEDGSAIIPDKSYLLAEIPPNSTKYVDNTQSNTENVGYIVAYVRGDNISYSELRANPKHIDVGPGSRLATWSFGNFANYGTVANSAVSPPEFAANALYTKYLRNGKFIYSTAALTTAALGEITNLINAGIGSGGVQPARIRGKRLRGEPDKIFQHNGYFYRARLPKFYDVNNTDLNDANYYIGMPAGKSELMDLLTYGLLSIGNNIIVTCDSFTGDGSELVAYSAAGTQMYDLSQRADGVTFIILEYIGSNPDVLLELES